MKNLLFFAILLLAFTACKKDKFATEPKIEFISVTPNTTSIQIGSVIPTINFSITDKEGDIGKKAGVDTAFIYLKNNLTGKSDSLPFPDLAANGKSSFEAEVNVSIERVLECKPLPSGALHVDTLYFDVYVRDFERNKSNVITTAPVYFSCR
ncbi:MAG: hypothetical protein EOO03_04595 [Chitinophagaceae bacterium]|nr:MAG: hypothetical protein EOO03_04595 [Chitinophagaceae bacterium]